MPPVAALDRCGGPVEADRGCIVMVAPGRPGAAPPAPAPLAAAILARWPEVTGPAAPLRVEVRTAAGRMWRGLLLPYEVPGGGVGAVEAVVTEAGVPDAPDLAGVADALAGLAGADEHMMGAAQWPGAAPADELLLEPLAAPLKRSVGRVVPPLSSPWGRLAA